jgi:hypothetical protein
MKRIVDGYQRKYPNPIKVATPAEPGPLLREATKFAEALRKVRRGDIAEASGLVGEVERDGYLGVIVERV